MSVVSVMNPSPPTCINISSMACPNPEKLTAVGRTTKPVTHTALVDVNNESTKFSQFPSLLEIGRHRKNAPTKMISTKPISTIKVGRKRILDFLFLSVIIFERANGKLPKPFRHRYR